MTSTLTFEPLQETHLAGAMRMSSDVGWPHRLEDWAFVAGMSHGVVAMDGETVVATALATPFAPVAMVNLVIVDAAVRGRGLGRDIMCRAMETVTPKAWRLVATQDGLPLYEKLGFQATGEILQHQGVVAEVETSEPADWATREDMATIRALDADVTGMDRATLYTALEASARFAVLRDETGVKGFAALRDFGRGVVAGPIIAASLEEAQSLLITLMADCTGQFLRVDTDADTGLAPWLAELGLAHVGGGIQMQKGAFAAAATGPHTVFALASQALG